MRIKKTLGALAVIVIIAGASSSFNRLESEESPQASWLSSQQAEASGYLEEDLIIPESEVTKSLERTLDVQADELARLKGIKETLERALPKALEEKEKAQRFYATELGRNTQLKGKLQAVEKSLEALEAALRQSEEKNLELEKLLHETIVKKREAQAFYSAELDRATRLNARLQELEGLMLAQAAQTQHEEKKKPQTQSNGAQTKVASAPAKPKADRAYQGSLHDGLRAYKKGNFNKAFNIWWNLARQGSRRAQFYVGGLYFDGRGVKRDLVLAHYWLSRSASAGFRQSKKLLKSISRQMTAEDLAQAEALLRANRG